METSSTSDFKHWKTLEEFEEDDTGKELFKYYLESKNNKPVFECIPYRYVPTIYSAIPNNRGGKYFY